MQRAHLKTITKAILTIGCLAYVIILAGPEQLLDAASSIDTWQLVIALLLLSSNIFFTSARLKEVLFGLGFRIPVAQVLKVNLVSQLAGVIFFQALGQAISRARLLRPWGVDAPAAYVLTLLERAIVGIVSLLLCLFGAFSLFGGLTRIEPRALTYLLKVAFVLGVVFCSVSWSSPGLYLKWLKRHFLQRLKPRNFCLATLYTVVGQLLVAFAYFVLAIDFIPDRAHSIRLFEGALVIMFIASIPISFAGWGVRELGAIWVFEQIGLTSGQAFLVAVLIGGMSLLLLLVSLGAAWLSLPKRIAEPAPVSHAKRIDFRRATAWGGGLCCAVLIFFQIRFPSEAGDVNLNIADPIAVGLGLLFIWEWMRVRCWPQWSIGGINTTLILISLWMTVSLVIGWLEFGWITWGWKNRYLGWFVLLAYLFSGAMLTSILGFRIRRAIVRTMTITILSIAVVELILAILSSAGGIGHVPGLLAQNIEGFAQNRNAFAFQILIAGWLGLLCASQQWKWRELLVSSMLVGTLVLVWSRASLGVVLVLAFVGATSRAIKLRSLALIAVGGGLVAALPSAARHLANMMGAGVGFSPLPTYEILRAGSDGERMRTIFSGLKAWTEHPVLGGGLGSYIAKQGQPEGGWLVIHNIYVWMLAETGLIGFLLFGALFVLILIHFFKSWQSNPTPAIVVLGLLVIMCVTGLVHDILYQRIFWFSLGLCLIAPYSLKHRSEQ